MAVVCTAVITKIIINNKLMIQAYKGEFTYSKKVVSDWNNSSIGVYYLWENKHIVYVGSGTGDDGIRGRLLVHLSENAFPRVTAFGYKTCSTTTEALAHEKSEIKRLKPKYNVVHNS